MQSKEPFLSASQATLSRTIWVALISSLFLVAATLPCPPSLYSDQATQLQAAKFYVEGKTSFPNIILGPVREDISQDESTWLIWWAPGFPVLASAAGKLGLSLGAASKAVVDVFFVVGCVAWAIWAYLFRLPRWLTYGLALSLPWIRYANNNLLQISGEILTWGVVPLALLGATLVLRAWRTPDKQTSPPARNILLSLGVGGLIGLLYCLKYSGFLLGCGILLYLGWRLVTGFSWRRSIELGVMLFGAGVPVITLNLVNRAMQGTANMLVASFHPHLSWTGPLFLVLELPLALADAGQIGDWLLMHAWSEADGSKLDTEWMGLPGLAWLAVLLWRHRAQGDVEKLALVTLLGNCLLLVTLWTLSSSIDYDRRFIATAAIAVLALVLKWSVAEVAESGWIYRAVSIGFLVFYIALPLGYGLVTVPMKAWRSHGYQASESGLFNPFLAQSNLREVRAALEKNIPVQGDYIWYCPDPLTYFELKGRIINEYVDFIPADVLASRRFITSKPLRLLMIMPDEFEASGKAEAVRTSFPQAKNWQKQDLPDSPDNLWTADLVPDASGK